MAKKVIRLTEADIEGLVRKIIKEESINELGTGDFKDTKTFDAGDTGSTLVPAIGKLKGKSHIVILDRKGNIIGYGPEISRSISRAQICTIAQRLIEDWEDEVNMIDELDQRDFQDAKPITFCSK